jgi:transcriptional regulator with XRE-family HTH domain
VYRTAQAWEQLFGSRVKQARLRANMSQNELAGRADLTTATISRLELGKGSSLETLIKALQVLGEENWLEQLAPNADFSPIQQFQLGKQRQRARKKELKP